MKHLGCILYEHASDNYHIVKEMRSMYTRGNMLEESLVTVLKKLKLHYLNPSVPVLIVVHYGIILGHV